MRKNLRELGKLVNGWNAAYKYAQDNAGIMRETTGRVVDVDDPEERGRIKVVLNEANPEVPESQGFPQPDGVETVTDWIDPFPSFIGKQPPTLVGLKVRIFPTQNDPNRLTFGDVIYDKEEDPKAEVPSSSNMTRLPVYPAGALPPATAENLGCVIVEQGGPQGYDWLMVCLNRGGYKWVRHIDLLHIHETQVPDSDGDGEGRVNDDVLATT